MSDVTIPDEPREPSLEHLLSLAGEAQLDGVRVGLPGIVTEYDKDKQRASVQPLIQHGYIVDGKRQVETLPIVHDVPVHFPGAGAARTTYPVKVGTVGWIKFASSSIAVWITTGGLVDPDDDRRHDLNDAVFEPGLHSFNAVPTDAPDDAIVEHVPDGMTLKIGSSGASQKIMGDSAITQFMAALTAAIVTDTSGALTKLKTALNALPGGWNAGTTKGLIE